MSEMAGVVDTTYASLGLPGSDMAKSPSSSEFLVDEEAGSTCPLLTPSPPAVLDYDQQLSPSSPDAEPEVALDFEIGDSSTDPNIEEDIHNFSNPLADEAFDATTVSVQSVESTSSGSSTQEPTACVQLLGTHHHYQQLAKSAESNGHQENGVASVPLTFDQFTAGGEYFFTTWNWPLIRRSCGWVMLSGVVGMICIAIALVATLPKQCEPEHMWWEAATVYEIFPASFQDSNDDSVGDLAGLMSRVGYLHTLGVSAVRLNSVFLSEHYPEGYDNPESLTEIHPKLGNLETMHSLIHNLRHNNISLILDLPVSSVKYNSSFGPDYKDPVANALQFWLSHKISGFYLVGLDMLEPGTELENRIADWRQVVGPGRLLVAPPGAECILCDLVHVSLDVTQPLKPQLDQALSVYPHILWSLGHSGKQRLADTLHTTNTSIGAILLLMSLPGTPSLLYGDEIGLKGVHDPGKEFEDLQHMRQLPPMAWASSLSRQGFSGQHIIPWLPTAATLLQEEGVKEARAALANMAALRKHSPQFYMTSSHLAAADFSARNFAVSYSDKHGVIAIERWYPRRHVIVTIANLGPHKVQRDLSSLYYGGRIVVSYPGAQQYGKYIKFKTLILESGETIVIELDK